MFEPVSNDVDFPEMESRLLKWWEESGLRHTYLKKNDESDKRFSFLDGPITANNPMGVHHAWGRTYKDLFQRYKTMQGFAQRYQNGFDCQGLWVEVEVEKELGLNSKTEIEDYGIAEFVEKCKERVRRFSAIQTEQSKRLGYWMNWENSYYTMSEENNYTIWHFLKIMHQRGLIYRGHDSMPWCTRCGTGLSEHEIVTEGYKEMTHTSLYVRLPMAERDASLVVWTTTPWTLPANVAVAVNPEETYAEVEVEGERLILAKQAARRIFGEDVEVRSTFPGSRLVGENYRGPFAELPVQQDVKPVIIPWEEADPEEGTGCVHIAPGCGKEDFELGGEFDLPTLAPLDEFGNFLSGYGFLVEQGAWDTSEQIIENLREKGLLIRTEDITHRYPVCWRCGEELVFRLVSEWFIDMDQWREEIMDVVEDIRWIPEFGKERELDWLRNMDDWMISKKRYWGLALPIWTCDDCSGFEVVGGRDELQERAVEGWEEFEGHTPHRPWVDEVKIACSHCGATMSRIEDVGNPWLDAGIVAYSTLHYLTDRDYWRKWFPADFITESFPGQFRNWFYSLLAMSAAITGEPPFLTVLGHGLVLDEHGEEMHKSAGNAIWFEDATDDIGADVMRWLYLRANPSGNVLFGYGTADDVRRQFIIPLWNVYSFFVTYARLDGFVPGEEPAVPLNERPVLDRWLYSRLFTTVSEVQQRLEDYDAASATRAVEEFVDDLSNWYVRRSRRRFWRKGDLDDEQAQKEKLAAYQTLYEALEVLVRTLAPFIPFTTEQMYQNLVVAGRPGDEHPPSVHLTDFPRPHKQWKDDRLQREMKKARQIASLGRAARNEVGLKVRQPLRKILVAGPEWDHSLNGLIKSEVNIREIVRVSDEREFLTYEIKPDYAKLGPKYTDDMPQVAAAIETADPRWMIEQIEAGEEFELDGYTLQPGELEVRTRNREGYAAATEEGYTVALDTELTPELRREGLARDCIRFVQQSRKECGLEVSDRIHLLWRTEGEMKQAMEDFSDVIADEVLARSFQAGDPRQHQHYFCTEIEGHKVEIGLQKA